MRKKNATALRQAYRDDLIAKNPYEFMPSIKREKSRMSYYNKDELEELFKLTDNSPLNLLFALLPIMDLDEVNLLDLNGKQ